MHQAECPMPTQLSETAFPVDQDGGSACPDLALLRQAAVFRDLDDRLLAGQAVARLVPCRRSQAVDGAGVVITGQMQHDR